MTCVHGTLVRVDGRGVLLCGDPGAGKSQLALELLERGHALVTDDAVRLHRQHEQVFGAPLQPELRDFLMIAGSLVINVRRQFGDAAVAEGATAIDLIVECGMTEPGRPAGRELAGRWVPAVTLARLPGSASVVEAAVRDLVLKQQGYDAAADLATRQLSLATGT